MRKLTLILCLLVSSALQAQTKEETIEWINTYASSFLKCKKHLGKIAYSLQIIVGEEGRLTMKYEMELSYLKQKDFVYDFQLKDIIINEFKPQDEVGVCFILKTKGAKVRVVNQWANESMRDWVPFYYSDEDGAVKVHKAIMHLAKLMGASAAVKKDIF